MKKLDGNFRENAHAGAKSTAEILRHLKSGLSSVFDREMVMAGAETRKLNVPGTETREGLSLIHILSNVPETIMR